MDELILIEYTEAGGKTDEASIEDFRRLTEGRYFESDQITPRETLEALKSHPIIGGCFKKQQSPTAPANAGTVEVTRSELLSFRVGGGDRRKALENDKLWRSGKVKVV